MLSDSSSSELKCSPAVRRHAKRYQVLTSESSDEDDTPVKRPTRVVRSRVPSSSDSSSSQGPTNKRIRKVLSSSDSSSSQGPRKKRVRKQALLDSETSDSSDSFESDGPVRPHRRVLRGGVQLNSDSYSSEVEVALGTNSANKKNYGSSSDSDGGEHCIICFKTLHHPVARPSACSHIFHDQCLSTWSKTSNTCPIDRVKYNSIDIVSEDNKVISSRIVASPTPGNHSDFEPDNPTFCEVCHFHDREEVMLLCDRCDAGYHIDCLDPPLESVPNGQWFCPSCELTSIEDSEVLELLADNVLLESRLRSRPYRTDRVNPRLHLSRRAVQAAFNLATSASQPSTSSYANDEPSTSTGRRVSSVKRRKTRKTSSRRKRTTKYKVELVTTEDGTTVEVKLAIQSRRRRKSKKKQSKTSKRGRGNEGRGRCNNESGSGHGPHSGFHPAPLDLFGSRPTLDYFSGCDAEDEEELGGEVGLLRVGQSSIPRSSGLVSRKGIARFLSLSSTSSPRPRPNIEPPSSSVNLLDDILRDLDTLHHPSPANVSSSSDGGARATFPQNSSEFNTRESAIHGGRGEGRGGGRYNNRYSNRGRFSGGRYSGARPSRGGTPNRNSGSGGSGAASSNAGPSSSQGGRSGDSNYHQSTPPFKPIPAPPIPPLIPPPEPPLRLCEDDDLDIYGDIEPPSSTAKLVPPPEPPAMLLALDNQAPEEGASSPDEGLVIDDQRDTYDPDQPNSPSSGNKSENEDPEDEGERDVELPDIPLPAQSIRLEDIKLPSPSKNDGDDSDSEVPIAGHYSKVSLKMARRSSQKSDSSEEDGQYIDDIIERFKKAPPLKDSGSPSNKIFEPATKLVTPCPVKEKLERLRKARNMSSSEEDTFDCQKNPGNEEVKTVPVKSSPAKSESEEKQLCSGDGTPVRDERDESNLEDDINVDQNSDLFLEKQSTDTSKFVPSSESKESENTEITDPLIDKNEDVVSKISDENLQNVEESLNEMETDVKLSDKESNNKVNEGQDMNVSEEIKSPEYDYSSDESSEKPVPKPQRKRNVSYNRLSQNESDQHESVERDVDGKSPGWSSQPDHDKHDDYWSQDDKKSTNGETNKDLLNGHKSHSHSPAKSLSSGEVESGTESEAKSDISHSPTRKKRKKKITPEADKHDDKSPSPCPQIDEDRDKEGLDDITDEEMSSYEKNWEMEESEKMKQVGLEGLETEAISECEDGLGEDATLAPPAKSNNETYMSKEEGEIITDDRNEFIPWKRVTKSTKDRSYREKEKNVKEKEVKEKTPDKKKKDKKAREKRKDLERYDIRKVIGDKRKKDEFGRDIDSSQSRSRSVTVDTGVVRSEVRRVRDWSKSRKRSRVRSLSRTRNRDRSISHGKRRRSRSRGRSLDKGGRSKRNYSRDKERKRSRGRSKTRRNKSRERKKSQSKKIIEKKKIRDESIERRDRNNVKDKSRDERDKRGVSSSSCSTCSCSSCERERVATNKLTVSVPPAPSPPPKKSKEKKKDKPRKISKKDSSKRRRTESPLPSKEVFTSGDNILVSVNFKSKSTGEPRRGGSRRVWEEEGRKKKDKENQPVRSVVPILAATQEKDKRRQRRRMASNAKPVAIIDLDPSPFREEAVSPQEVIVLTDESDNEAGGKNKQSDNVHQNLSTGPKTPPEPPQGLKFTISSKPQLRSLNNPLEEVDEEGDRDMDDDGGDSMVMHKGPNTPPEPPETYDPFEPTKSRSPTPRRDNIRGPNATDNQIVSNSEVLIDKQQPSPQPKTQETVSLDKPNFVNEADLDFCLGGDSPYSPGSSEADDLFDPPPVTPTRSKPVHPLGKLPLPPAPLLPLNKPKLAPSPNKRRQPNRLTPVPRKAQASKKEIGIRLDENQLKILDELPSSAVEMQVKDKFLKKLNRQERVVEEVKFVLKPHYNKKHVTKEEYKDILRKAVPKICHSKSGEINPFKIQKLIEAYVKKYRHKRKKTGPAPPGGVVKPKPAKVLPPILKSMFGNLGMRSQDTLNNRNAVMNKTM